MPLPTVDPLKKTETELRRSIDRLIVFRVSNPDGFDVTPVIESIKKAYLGLPKEVRKIDYSN